MAKVLRGTLAEDATVFRYGGEEFSMLFPGMDLEEAKALLERARSAISGEVFQGNEHRLRVTATSGVACLENHELAGDVIYRADEALYAGKREGRDSGYWHDGQKVRPMFGAPRAMSDLASDCRTPSDSTEEEDDTDCPADSSQRCLDRESFLSVVGRLTSQWMKGGAPLAVVLVELSRAPTTPAVCRPEETDAAKRYLLDVIRHCIRGSDVFTQIDQSVFAILLPESGSPRAGMVAQRIQRLVNRPFTRNQREVADVRVNTSIADIASGCKGDDLVARAPPLTGTCPSRYHGSSLNREAAYRQLPYIDFDRSRGYSPTAWWREWMLQNTAAGADWQAIAYQTPENYARVQAPSLAISGWFDANFPGTPMNYLGMKQNGGTADSRRPRMVVGPWEHIINTQREAAGIDFGPQALIDWDGYVCRWFDFHLKGIANGILADPPLYVFVMGRNQWRSSTDWPLTSIRSTSGDRPKTSLPKGTASASRSPAVTTRTTCETSLPAKTTWRSP